MYAAAVNPIDKNDKKEPDLLIRVLLVEDSEDDAFLVVRALKRSGYQVDYARVDGEKKLIEALGRRKWDVVLSDYSMPNFDAFRALEVVHQSDQKGVPFIIVSGAIGEETAVQTMRAGVHDYVLKHKLDRLAPAIAREMRSAKERAKAHQLQRRLMHADRLAAIGQLAAGVAHEINNPLAFISGNVEILGEHIQLMSEFIEVCKKAVADETAPDLDELRRILKTGDLEHALYDMQEIRVACMSGGERIAAIVRDLRTFARIENDDVELFQLNDIVNTACNMVENTIRHKAILKRDLGDIPFFAGDSNKLTQLVVNLLVNAAQAIEDGEPGENMVKVTTRLDDEHSILTVEDTGIGIPEVVRKQIFEPFFTTKSRDEGTGLGLALCADIARKHKGTISVASELGKGSCFTVRIPLDTGLMPKRRRVPTSSIEYPRSPARILIIDDEVEVLNTYKRVLANDHEVVLASGGEQGLGVLDRDEDFDIILCDLMMPKVDGLMLYREVAGRAPQLTERFIFITGGAFTARMSDFVAKIGNRVLEKPVSAKRLKRMIDRQCSKRPPRSR